MIVWLILIEPRNKGETWSIHQQYKGMDLIDYGVLKRISMQHVEIITGLLQIFVQKTISFGNLINDLSKKNTQKYLIKTTL